jgi:hypothetical protein
VDTVFHVMKSDVKWLYRLSGFLPSSVEKDALDPYMAEGQVVVSRVAERLADFVYLRKRIDEAMIAVIAAIPEAAFLKDLEIEFGPKTIKRRSGSCSCSGSTTTPTIAARYRSQLDALGIDNDYSGVLDKIE